MSAEKRLAHAKIQGCVNKCLAHTKVQGWAKYSYKGTGTGKVKLAHKGAGMGKVKLAHIRVQGLAK